MIHRTTEPSYSTKKSFRTITRRSEAETKDEMRLENAQSYPRHIVTNEAQPFGSHIFAIL